VKGSTIPLDDVPYRFPSPPLGLETLIIKHGERFVDFTVVEIVAHYPVGLWIQPLHTNTQTKTYAREQKKL